MEARLLEANSKLEKMIVLLGGEIFQEKGESIYPFNEMFMAYAWYIN